MMQPNSGAAVSLSIQHSGIISKLALAGNRHHIRCSADGAWKLWSSPANKLRPARATPTSVATPARRCMSEMQAAHHAAVVLNKTFITLPP
jgi:hypothetical protein